MPAHRDQLSADLMRGGSYCRRQNTLSMRGRLIPLRSQPTSPRTIVPCAAGAWIDLILVKHQAGQYTLATSTASVGR